MKRLLAVALLAVSFAVTAEAAPREVRRENGRIVVEFWHGMGGPQGETVNALVEDFNKSQEKYRVLGLYQGRYDALNQKLIASLYAGRSPAAAQMYPSWTNRFYRYGYLKPVSEFDAADDTWGEAEIRDFYPIMIEENTVPGREAGEPTLVTLPFNKSVYVLYINQTRLEAAGYTEGPKTWDEFIEMAEKLTTRDAAGAITTYGFASRPYIEDLTVQAMSANTQLLDEASGKALLETEPVNAAFHFLKRLVGGEGDTTVGYVETDYLSNVFGAGRIAMYISSTASFNFNDQQVGSKFIWRAYPVPGRDANTPGRTLSQGTNIGIFGSVPEEEQQGAWEFLKFLTSPEVSARWAKRTGYMPIRKSSSALPEFAKHLETDISYRNAVSTLERSAYEPRMMYWESIRSQMSRQVESVLLGRKTVEAALKESSEFVEEVRATAE